MPALYEGGLALKELERGRRIGIVYIRAAASSSVAIFIAANDDVGNTRVTNTVALFGFGAVVAVARAGKLGIGRNGSSKEENGGGFHFVRIGIFIYIGVGRSIALSK